ncbi:MAG: 50S ribosomal protein L9, partial [Proteobacteria bacterium]
MQVILLDRVQNLGDLGDVVEVKSGFARNYLIPQKMAARASAENIKAFEAQKVELVAKAKESLAAAQARAEALKDVSVVISANASPEGHLYGSVGPREISEKLT